MNISKVRALWSLLKGGWAGLAEYVLEAVNGYLKTLDPEKVREAALVAKSLANAVEALTPLLPEKYTAAVAATTDAVAFLAETLADGNVTEDELDRCIDLVEAAVAKWKEAR